jgi:hypothetical protein
MTVNDEVKCVQLAWFAHCLTSSYHVLYPRIYSWCYCVEDDTNVTLNDLLNSFAFERY